jgi:hypothetical protein
MIIRSALELYPEYPQLKQQNLKDSQTFFAEDKQLKNNDDNY